jgi:hypothetical protein
VVSAFTLFGRVFGASGGLSGTAAGGFDWACATARTLAATNTGRHSATLRNATDNFPPWTLAHPTETANHFVLYNFLYETIF